VKMKEAGCTRIQVGIETGDSKLLATAGKAGCTAGEAEKTMRQLHELGILVEANFIVGLPGENWSTVRNTAKMIRKTRPDDVAISMITPYPGTPLFALAKKRNWIVTEDWNKYSTSQPVMASPSFSAEEMKEAQRYLYGTFLYGRRLGELDRALRKHMFRRFFQELATSLPEIGFGAYAITRYGIKSRLGHVPKKLEN
jgi:anaerobic magnesium-protoporphyrin IX monomethyl ester cyclase